MIVKHSNLPRKSQDDISNKTFNKALGLAFACLITSTKRDFPFHIKIQSQKISGFIMAEQLKSIDYNSRNIKFVEKVGKEILEEIEAIVDAIIK